MTNIEWVKNPDGAQGITWNPITGCLNHVNGLCKGGGFPCYAYKLANTRLKQRYLANLNIVPPTDAGLNPETATAEYVFRADRAFADPFYPRCWPERLDKIRGLKKPTGIFLDDMSDWMGDYWPEEWTRQELKVMRDCPQHRFYTLTKQPQRLPEFSPFPENCWVGVTACNQQMFIDAVHYLVRTEATIRYISFEPLLSEIPMTPEMLMAGCDWLIIGACTGSYLEMMKLHLKTDIPISNVMKWGKKWTLQPRIEWVREIIEAADKAGVKVFLKDNLGPLGLPLDSLYYSQYETGNGPEYQLRQEMPETKRHGEK